MNLLVLGSGAIGRGYLPWIFKDQNPKYYFVDSDPEIITHLKKRERFRTHMVQGSEYASLQVSVAGAYLPQNFLSEKPPVQFDAVFVSVGPRNVPSVAPLVSGLQCPIILCENDPASVEKLKVLTGQDNIYFAIPDVITSNTAPAHFLKEDPLAITSENGVLFVDDRISKIPGNFKNISYKELIDQQWTAKLYLHNTPHCIAAYLGALAGVKYLHQSMEFPEIDKIVSGSMEEMLNALKARWDIPHPFLDWYAAKELSRFRCQLLFDPISRVAREPLRKLELDGRLIGAAQICLSLGFVPENIMLGITSALLFDDPNDKDKHLSFMQRALTPSAFLTHVLGLRYGEALETTLCSHLPKMISQLKSISKIMGPKNELGV
jgi:mannitol-1-phosphate 5-dehydrogenase